MRTPYGLSTFLLTFALTCSAAAQEVELQGAAPLGHRPAHVEGYSTRIHITDDLTRSPEGQEALRKYHEAREAGLLQAGKGSGVTYSIGETKDFNVRTDVHLPGNKWITVNFTLRAANAVANVWVATSLNETVAETQMDELEEHILNTTPEGSFRPDHGIIQNDNFIFGDPPLEPNSDGKVDVLMHDIYEGEDVGCCVLGYVTSVDLDRSPPAGQGNRANTLYVDLPDGLKSGIKTLAGTIAHEYQHLIHYAFQGFPGQEETFVNEGMSEWAELVNGYITRPIYYLQNTDEHGTQLLTFRRDSPISVVENDYQRAGLFTTYIADRIGWEATGSIIRVRDANDVAYATGAEGYGLVLAEFGLSLGSVVADFHTANFVNDLIVDPKFGYVSQQRKEFTVTPTISYDGMSAASSFESVSIATGAVHYTTWANVADLDLGITDGLTNAPGARARSSFRIFASPLLGPSQVIELDAEVTDYLLAGDFERVTLIVSNTDIATDDSVHYDISAEWQEGGADGIQREIIAYDDGAAAASDLDGAYFISPGPGFKQASRFAVPMNGRLTKVFVAPLYENAFSSSTIPAGTPRDFRLHVYADSDGEPGEELFSTDVPDNPSASHVNLGTLEYNFLEYDVPEDDLFASLPDTIYIGLSDTGSDENYLVLHASERENADESFLYIPGSGDSGGWASLSDVFTSTATEDSVYLFPNHVFPIRAEFLVSTPTAFEAVEELPEAVTLSQNYPNPFNPAANVSYSLPRAMHVRLAIYDALGRRVAVLAQGMQSAGTHEAVIDASGWASGVYLYMLETEGQTQTRRMVVLK